MLGSRRTDIILLLVAVVWGSSYLAAKTVTGSAPVLTVLFLRYGISALALVFFVRRINRRELKVGGLLGLSQAAVLLIETYGVTRTSAANAGVIISLTLVLTPLMDRRRMPPKFFLAAGLCVVAVGLLMSGNGLHTPGTGDLLMLAAAVVRAAHVALVGRLATDLRPLQVTTVQTFIGTALFAAPAVNHLPTDAGLSTWLQLLYLALFCSVFAFLAQTWAVSVSATSDSPCPPRSAPYSCWLAPPGARPSNAPIAISHTPKRESPQVHADLRQLPPGTTGRQLLGVARSGSISGCRRRCSTRCRPPYRCRFRRLRRRDRGQGWRRW